jgi:hypothetical protein
MTRKPLGKKYMERVYAVKLPQELFVKLRSMYSSNELASLVRRYLEFLTLEKRSFQ